MNIFDSQPIFFGALFLFIAVFWCLVMSRTIRAFVISVAVLFLLSLVVKTTSLFVL